MSTNRLLPGLTALLLSAATLLAALGNSPAPNFETPDTKVVSRSQNPVGDQATDMIIEDSEDGRWYDDCLNRVLALVLPPEALAEHIKANYSGDPLTRDELVDDACFGVQDLRLYWLDHAPKPETRRVGPQPGRNDPCPCGSGKKYKKCHLAER